jgi:hypothetical protein
MKKPPKHVWVTFDQYDESVCGVDRWKVDAEDRVVLARTIHRYTLDEPQKKAGKGKKR